MTEHNPTLAHLPMLTDAQRLDARRRARDTLLARLGGEPRWADFERRQTGRYGKGTERTFAVLLWALLLAAFGLSAIHIYAAAHTAYGEGIANPTVQVVAGVLFVAVAEIASLLFSTAPAIYEEFQTPALRLLAYTAALLAALVAIVGNVTVSIPYPATPLAWVRAWLESALTEPMLFLVATVPPILVLSAGQLQKVRLLAANARHHAARVAYEREWERWERTVAHIEGHPDFTDALAWALWEAWCKGKRRALLATITPDVREALVRRELAANRFFRAPSGTPPDTPPETAEPPNDTPSDTRPETAGETAAVERVKHHLLAHPGDATLSLRTLGERLGVSYSSVRRAKADLFGTRNGHGRA